MSSAPLGRGVLRRFAPFTRTDTLGKTEVTRLYLTVNKPFRKTASWENVSVSVVSVVFLRGAVFLLYIFIIIYN